MWNNNAGWRPIYQWGARLCEKRESWQSATRKGVTYTSAFGPTSDSESCAIRNSPFSIVASSSEMLHAYNHLQTMRVQAGRMVAQLRISAVPSISSAINWDCMWLFPDSRMSFLGFNKLCTPGLAYRIEYREDNILLYMPSANNGVTNWAVCISWNAVAFLE